MRPDPAGVDQELRSLVAGIACRAPRLAGRSLHLHQLDGARMEAMVYLEAAGARVEWVHGRGDCAITGEGAAMLAMLRGEADPDAMAASGRLVLYGDPELIRMAPALFESPGTDP
jgi:predicted lipid carrier protein YhbT